MTKNARPEKTTNPANKDNATQWTGINICDLGIPGTPKLEFGEGGDGSDLGSRSYLY
jgi:hypothetical protein